MESALLHAAGATYVGDTDEVCFLENPPVLSQGVFNEFVVGRSSNVVQTSALLSAPTISPEQARTLHGREAYGIERFCFACTV